MPMRILGAALVLFALFDVAQVEAQVAVDELRGPRASTVRRNLISGLESAGHTIVDEGEAQLVVRGRVLRRAGRWRATLRLTDGSGESLGRVSGSARSVGGLGSQLARRVGRKLAEVSPSAPEPEPEPEPQPASAGGSGMRVVVGEFSGRAAGRTRTEVVRALSDQVEVVPRSELESVASQLGVSLDDEGLTEAAARTNVSAYITGRNSRRGSRWSANVTVRNASNGAEVDTVRFRGRNPAALGRAIRRGGWDQLGPAILQTSAPPQVRAAADDDDDDDEDDDDEEDDEDEDEDDDDDDDDVAPGDFRQEYNALDIAILGHPFSRKLRYNDDFYQLLREYTLDFGPAIQLTGRWYPGAHVTNGFMAHIGFDVSWERAFAIDSKRSDGIVFPTEAQSWYVGLRGRVPLDRHEVTMGVGYGNHSFSVDTAGPSQPGRRTIPQIPGVDYRFIKLQVESRLAIVAGLRVTLFGAYLIVLDAGGPEEDIWFPRTDSGGIEAGILLGYETASGIEIRLGWDVRRYFYSFNVEVNDPFIAGGAVDQYFGYTFGLAYRL
ncbi:MAG: hypothetical protein AAGE52_07895 [Myxococcota bacterium]